MLLSFFDHLRRFRVPVSLREFIDLHELMDKRLVFADQDAFYFLARMCLVKDEKFYDRFDQAFAHYFEGIGDFPALLDDNIEDNQALEELKRMQLQVPPKEFDRLLEEYQKDVDAMKKALLGETEGESHAGEQGEDGTGEEGDSGDGGDGGEGDGGESGEEGDGGEEGERGDEGEEGEGDDGEKGEGVSEEGEEGEKTELTEESKRRASKVWLLREYQDYDPDVELGTRNLKMSLRRLRKWARTEAELELDLDETIRRTARSAGILDIVEVPERHNAVKVLLLLDIGGSMDDHIELCAQLFSAARSEFKHLEYFYFHNMIYEGIWKHNDRRIEDKVPVHDVLRTYGRDYKVIFVGDADMGRHELNERGGSVELFNPEPGKVWLQRVTDRFRHVVWLNPVETKRWNDSYTISAITRMVDGHMYHLSPDGINEAVRYLMR